MLRAPFVVTRPGPTRPSTPKPAEEPNDLSERLRPRGESSAGNGGFRTDARIPGNLSHRPQRSRERTQTSSSGRGVYRAGWVGRPTREMAVSKKTRFRTRRSDEDETVRNLCKKTRLTRVGPATDGRGVGQLVVWERGWDWTRKCRRNTDGWDADEAKVRRERSRTGSVLVLHPDPRRMSRSRPRNPDAPNYLQQVLSTRVCKINNMHRIKRRKMTRAGSPQAKSVPDGQWISGENPPELPVKQTCRRASMSSKEQS